MLKYDAHSKSIRIEVETITHFKYILPIRYAVFLLIILFCATIISILLLVFLQGHSGIEYSANSLTFALSPATITSPLSYVTPKLLHYVNADERTQFDNSIEDHSTLKDRSMSMTNEATTTFTLPGFYINTESRKDLLFAPYTGSTFNSASIENDTADIVTHPPTTVKHLLPVLYSESTKAAVDEDVSFRDNENILSSVIQAFFGRYAYHLFGYRATFQDAKEKCQQFNSSLIYIENDEEEEMINDLVLGKVSALANNASQIMMWTAGYMNSSSLTTVCWNDSSIKSSYERLCHGEIGALSSKLRRMDRNSRMQEVHRIVKDFTKPVKTAAKWRETHCWRLFEDKVIWNTTMHFACKAKIDTASHHNRILNSSAVQILGPLRQMNFFTLASYKEAEALCNKSESTLVSIESEEDDEAIDRRIEARKDEFLSDPSIPTEELWNTLSPWMVWTSGFYDLASESMFPWEWTAKHSKFCNGALDRANAFWRSSRGAISLVHIVKNYAHGRSCWELLDPSYALQRNYSLPVMCQSKMPSRLFKLPNYYS